jgi:hypothetical protein
MAGVERPIFLLNERGVRVKIISRFGARMTSASGAALTAAAVRRVAHNETVFLQSVRISAARDGSGRLCAASVIYRG